MSDTAIPDGMTELYDADVPRADLVGAAANGIHRPLIAKQADGAPGLLDPDYVRGLIAKAQPRTPDAPETVTMTGSPAAIAALIHSAALRKAEMDTADINDLPDSDFAYVEAGGHKDETGRTVPRDLRHFPIHDEAHVRDALGRAPQSPFGDKAMPKIRAAAEKFGIKVAKGKLPDLAEITTLADRVVDGSLKKDMGAMEMDDTDGTLDLLDAHDGETPGDPAEPGSPAWEAIDAATARRWTAILARARSAMGVMADREMLETVSPNGTPDDADHAADLEDAACAIDYAIGILAPFAVDEQAEADCGADDMEMLGKAMAGFDTAALETIEAYAPLRKAGRALSTANETAIRAALTSLETILASLPKAPDAEPAEPAAMQKETDDMSDTNSGDPVQAAIESSRMLGTPKEPASAETPAAMGMPGHVAKADKPEQMAVYDPDGNLIGVIDPADLTRLMSAKAPAPAMPDNDGTDGGTDGAMAGENPGDDGTPTDMAPAPAATVGTPADAVTADDDGNVAKAATPDTTVPDTMLKSTVAELVKAALDEHSAAQADLVKGLEDRNRTLEEHNKALAKQAESLVERIDRLENAPAVMAIASNGAVPPAHLMRGQDRGAPADMGQAQMLKAKFNASDDALEKKRIADEMQNLAIEKFAAMQRR